MGWKESVLDQLGVNWIRLSPEEWLLLFHAVDGRKPVKGIATHHIAFLMTRQPVFKYKPLLLGVYSPEIHSALNNMLSKGLVKREYSYENRRLIETYSLTQSGEAAARRILEKIKGSWILIGDMVLREGSRVLSELEAVKKTYNGRGIHSSLQLILDKLETVEGLPNLNLTPEETEYIKKLYRSFKMER